VRNSKFRNCQIKNASSDTCGGAGISAILVLNLSIDDSEFISEKYSSQESMSLVLVLAPSSTISRVQVARSKFEAHWAAAVTALCVGDNGIKSKKCPDLTQSISVVDSHITSHINQNETSRNNLNHLLILDRNVQQSFKNFRIHCHNELVVFKNNYSDSPQHNDEYYCSFCPTLRVSLSGSHVFVENITKANTQCINLIPQNRCPFGISACTTFVKVSNGFWTNWSWSANKSGPASSVLLNVSRCPRGYCGCEHSACVLQSMLIIDRDPDHLCKGNRTGKLCGGCIPNYTQSMDEKTCISNQECKNNLWWVWTLLIIGFLLFSLYIVISCGELNDGSIKCVFFFIQISSFASSPDETSSSYAILELLQFHSLGVT
jgi:hypothetical protein